MPASLTSARLRLPRRRVRDPCFGPWVAELDRRPLRSATAVEPIEPALLPAVLLTQELVDAGVVGDAGDRFYALTFLLAAEVRRSDEHPWISPDAPHLPSLCAAPHEQPLAIVADDPDWSRHRRAVALERRQADVAAALEITESIHCIRVSVHRILGRWQVSTSKRWSTPPSR